MPSIELTSTDDNGMISHILIHCTCKQIWFTFHFGLARGVFFRFGGTSEKESQSGENYHNDVWKFDLINNTWTKPRCTGSIPLGRDCHAAAVVGNLMYVFGGRRAMGNAGDSIAFDMLGGHII